MERKHFGVIFVTFQLYISIIAIPIGLIEINYGWNDLGDNTAGLQPKMYWWEMDVQF